MERLGLEVSIAKVQFESESQLTPLAEATLLLEVSIAKVQFESEQQHDGAFTAKAISRLALKKIPKIGDVYAMISACHL